MPLTKKKIKELEATGKRCRGADGGGLYLQFTPPTATNPDGGKLWRMDYRFNGKRLTVSFGAFPGVSIELARKLRDNARALLAQGINPMTARREEKKLALQQEQENEQTFTRTALEWYQTRLAGKSAGYRKSVLQRMEKWIFPAIGSKPMATLDLPDLLDAMKPLANHADMGKRVSQLIGQVCRFARVKQYVKTDISSGLSECLPPKPPVKHRAAILDPVQFGILLNALDQYEGDISTRYALRIMPHVFVRSGELRGARWSEINFEDAIWRIPPERTKMRREHLVPLSRQVVGLFRELEQFRLGDLIFPSPIYNKKAERGITDMCLLNALRRLGYGPETMCIHGFRSVASTFLNEMGFRPDLVETQLAHGDPDKIRAAYNRAQYLRERTTMMQRWSDYLSELKASAFLGKTAN